MTCRTQEMGGLRGGKRVWYPPLSSLFVTSVWTRAYIWDPRFQTACMQAGVYSGLTGGVAYRGVPQSRVGYARFGLPALPPPEQASAAKVSLW